MYEGKALSEKTALYGPKELLAMDGLDELDRMKTEPNPFWNRARLDITWSLPVMSGLTESDRIRSDE